MQGLDLADLGIPGLPLEAELHVLEERQPCVSGREWLELTDHVQHYSLVYVIDRKKGKVLLGHKKRGFGKGKWNGYGGKPEEGECMLSCAVRELYEESHLLAKTNDLRDAGGMLFCSAAPSSFNGKQCLNREGKTVGWTAVVHLFVCEKWEGSPVETDEMRPKWFKIPSSSMGNEDLEDIPFNLMWPEARFNLPPLLGGCSKVLHNSIRIFGRADYYDHEESKHASDDKVDAEGAENSGETGKADTDGMIAWWFAIASSSDAESAPSLGFVA